MASKFQYVCFIFKQFSSLNLEINSINSIVLDDKREKSCNFLFQDVFKKNFLQVLIQISIDIDVFNLLALLMFQFKQTGMQIRIVLKLIFQFFIWGGRLGMKK